MSEVVEKLDIALQFQEISEGVEQPMDYEEMIKTVVPPLVYRSKEELKMLLSKGIFVNEGKTWFSLDKNGKHIERIPAAECLISIDVVPPNYVRDKARYRGVHIEGIEFRPVERVEYQVLEDDEVDMKTISHSDTYLDQNLPSDHEDILKCSKDSLQWTTKEELYSILRKGFPINDGEEWFSLDENGKKCHMLSARMSLGIRDWKWRSSPDSRFGKVAFEPRGGFWIDCRPKMLSPQTTYAIYLVYKLQENHSGFEPPVRVSDDSNSSYNKIPWYIYLLLPQTPMIYNKSHSPLDRRKRKGRPQQRNDGWLEVQVWEFQTGTTTKEISKYLRLTLSENESLKGLIVEGIEFKPA
ncbi:hypothetical protein L1887_27617 [Cichorium endivia]|nr:hypothetical protein L1887_27617 [Cichorium endivia]